MLAYLDALCFALRRRDAARIAELLRHPLASALPSTVIEEAERIAKGRVSAHTVPVHALRLYHQTAHLFGACADPAVRSRATAPPPLELEPARQMELEFPARAAVA